MNKSACLSLLLLLIWTASPSLTGAWEQPESGTLNFILENDIFYEFDRHYTNGIRLLYEPGLSAAKPEWPIKIARSVPWFPKQGAIHHGYAFGQSMFTPNDITIENPPLDDRPYAGWLYCAVSLGVESGQQLDMLTLTAGVVGPSSLAEESQTYIHAIVDADEPKGWDTQLDDELGLVISSQRSWRGISTISLSESQLDLTPHLGLALGNVFTYVNGGLTLRYGRQLPDDYGPPRIQPGLTGSGDFSPVDDFGWYFFAGIECRAVAQNIFLDGNTFHDSRSVDKEPLVGDLQLGLVVDCWGMRLSYTHVIRTREFETQDRHDDFGVFTMSCKI